MDLIEVNEAFAPQYLAVEKALELPRAKTNVNGGAIAPGHPLAASGAELPLTSCMNSNVEVLDMHLVRRVLVAKGSQSSSRHSDDHQEGSTTHLESEGRRTNLAPDIEFLMNLANGIQGHHLIPQLRRSSPSSKLRRV